MATTNRKLKGNGKKPDVQNIQANLQLLPMIMDNIPQAVFWKDRDLVYLGCNRAFAEDAGFASPEEVVGKTDYDMPWKDQAELYRADDCLVMEKGESKLNYEEPQTTPSGSVIWLRTSKIPVQEAGKVVAVLGMYEDITEYKKAQTMTEHERGRFQTILETIRIPTIISRLSDGIVLYANQAIAEVSQVHLDKLIGFKTGSFYANPDDRKTVLESLQKYGQINDFEVQFRRTDGSLYWALLSSRIIDYEGERCVLSTYVDITERKQAEEELLFRDRALGSSLNAVFIVGLDFKPLYANGAFLKLTGYTYEEAMQLAVPNLTGHPEGIKRIDEAMSTQGFFIGEEPVRRKDGSIFPTSFSTSFIKNAEGQPIAIQTTFVDITERKQAEEALRESQDRFRRFTEATGEGLVFHEQGKIIDANPAGLAMFGLTEASDFIGRNLMEFVAPEFHQLILEKMRHEDVPPYEIQCIRADHSIFPVETSTRTYKHGDRIIRATSIRDITERKRTEKELEAHHEFSEKQAAVFAELTRSKTVYSGDIQAAFAEVTEAAAKTLNVRRASIWYYNDAHTEIRCMDLFEQGKGHSEGIVLTKTDFPAYFKALEDERVIAADNAHTDPATQEFSTSYLTPLGINSMLDAPIRLRGKVIGVICNEHVGPFRQWTVEEQNFARTIVDFVTVAVETQERKQTEEELLLRDRALASSINAVFISSLDSKTLYVNDAFVKMFGYTLAEAMQITPMNVAARPEDLQEGLSTIRSQGFWTGESIGKRKDGSELPVSLTASLITNAEGQPIAMQATFIDISKRRRAEAAMQEANTRMQAVLDAATQVAIIATDPNGVLTVFNPGAEQMLGYSAKELVGKQTPAVIHAEAEVVARSRELTEEFGRPIQGFDVFAEYPRQGRFEEREWTYVRKDGTALTVSLAITALRGSEGEITGFLGIARDITERKQAEQALRDSEARYSAVVTQAQDGIVIIQDNILQFVNEGMAKMLGYTAPELMNTPIINYIAPESRELIVNRIKARLAGQEVPNIYEAKLQRKDGTVIDCELSAGAIEYRGRPADVGMIRDITERKQTEKILQQSEARLSSALHVAQMGLWEFDIPTGMFTFNDQYYSLHGRTAQEVGSYQMSVQRFAQEFVHPEDAASVGQATQQAIETTDPNFQVQMEARILHADGKPRWVTVWFRIEKDAQGRTIKLHGVNQDITDRKRAELEIGQEKALSDAIINGLPGVFYLFDTQGRMIRWNKQYETVLGYTTEETAARNAIDPIADEDKQRTAAVIQNVFVEGQATVEANLVTRDGRRIPYYFAGQRLDLGDQVLLAGTGIDITDRKRAEMQVERNLHETQVRYEVSQALAGAQTEEDVLDVLIRHAGVYSQAHVSIFTIDQTQSEPAVILRRLDAFESNVPNQMHIGMRLPASLGGQLFNLLSSEEPFVSNDILTDERLDGPSREIFRPSGVISHAVFPLRSGNVWIGSFAVTSKLNDYFDEEKQHLYRALSELGATALQTARLRDQIQDSMTRRGLQVQLSTQVSQSIAAAASLGELYERVVTQIKEQFGYYHTQLLRYDTAQEAVVLVTGYGETGARMLAAGHRLPMGEGLIGTAAATGETVLRSTLENDPDWHPNPLLPETKGEIAVPIKLGNTVLGVLDVQSSVAGALDADDQLLLEGLCGQVATAIEDTRLREEMSERLEEINRLYRAMSHEGWQTYRQTADIPSGFMFDQAGLRPVTDPGLAEELFARVPLTVPGGEIIGTLAVADNAERPITPDEEAFLQQVSEQLALALESARLFEQTQGALGEVRRRASELETVATVSTAASTLLDPDQLLQSVVDLTKERFSLYHAHIYLVSPDKDALALAAGAGEVGRQMLAEGWSIPANHELSIVANAYRKQQPVVANDLHRDKTSAFLSNRLLPNTRSEMALPLIVGDQVLGVFDVQSDQANAFTPEDINIYTTLASQVAVALQNARSYVEQAALVTQLRELDKLKSSFLANMSHELRTPLNSILGFADVILEELDGPLTENMNNDLRLIQKNGQHLLHLINDVLDMAKIEAGRMNLNPETFTACEVLEEVTSITSTLASEKNLALFIKEEADKDVKIYADRTRLRQVMINLVNNAIKFTETGNISLNVASIPGARILITVKDTGIGIPPDKLEPIFQEFTQVDSSTTRKAGGTGLGLPISRRLVEMHGGRLWAESTGVPGEGSTFLVELPIEARITETIEKQVK